MRARELTPDSTVQEVYAHPMGRDAIDKILLSLGRSRRWVDNPLVRRIPLKFVQKVLGRRVGESLLHGFLTMLNDVDDVPAKAQGPVRPAWWKEAVFYQVYPRSFADSDGDGVGDLRGIIDHLDHFVELGVDCVWLSPVFASPNQDFGYDISDYRAIMAEMGSMADMDELIAGCHERGLRIILDLVVNHTSDQHPWFQDFVADPDGPHADYYIVRKGTEDELPNNWASFFSGPAWRWIPEARRWAMHLFGGGQIDLNWDNPDVRGEVADIVQWWLARGVDGFRLDVINFISKREGLPDGDPFIGGLMEFTGIEHYYHGPHLHEYLAELRREGFTRKDVAAGTEELGGDARPVMIGETPGIGMEVGRLLTGEDRGGMDLIFNFDVLESPGKFRWDDYAYDLNHLKQHYIDYQSRLGSGDWISIFWDNHDNPRRISKVSLDPQFRDAIGKALATIQMTMRGTPFLYQGQEIAAVNQDFPDATALRDVESINRLAESEARGEDGLASVLTGSRDHARTPMRWDRSQNLGFTTGEPWIAHHENSVGHTVEEQRVDENSVFHHYRRMIELRRAHRALTLGEIEFVEQGRRNYFAWYRSFAGERWFVEVNLSSSPLARPLRDVALEVVLGPDSPRSEPMAPYESRVCRVL